MHEAGQSAGALRLAIGRICRLRNPVPLRVICNSDVALANGAILTGPALEAEVRSFLLLGSSDLI
jgi:hypothetical protein